MKRIMCFSQENRFLSFYYFGKFLLNTCSYVTESCISAPTATKTRFFVTLVNGSKSLINIAKSSNLDVAGSEIRASYLMFYRIVLFCYLELENSGPYSHLHGNLTCYFINWRNYQWNSWGWRKDSHWHKGCYRFGENNCKSS